MSVLIKVRKRPGKEKGREDRSRDWSDGAPRKQKKQEAFSPGA